MANSHRVLTIDTSRWKHEMGLRAEHLARFGGLLEEIWAAHHRIANALDNA